MMKLEFLRINKLNKEVVAMLIYKKIEKNLGLKYFLLLNLMTLYIKHDMWC